YSAGFVESLVRVALTDSAAYAELTGLLIGLDGFPMDDLAASVAGRQGLRWRLSNAVTVKYEDAEGHEKEKLSPRTVQEIRNELLYQTGGFPKRCDEALFALDPKRNEPVFLTGCAKTFGWFQERAEVVWHPKLPGAVPEEQFYYNLTLTTERYDVIE